MRRPSSPSPAVRILALVLIAIGAALAIAAFFADQLNLTGGGTGLGWLQLIGVIVGLAVFLIGVGWLLPASPRHDIDERTE